MSESTVQSLETKVSDCKVESSVKSKCGPSQKKKQRHRRGHKGKYAPYSAKHFLGRPKINAPANTTQFIFEDKDLGLDLLFESKNTRGQDSSSDIESEISPSAISCTSNAGDTSEDLLYGIDGYSNASDKFMTEEFDRMYDDMRVEMLRNESPDALSSRCIELESAIHNLQYLLEKESQRRHQMEEIIYLKKSNTELFLQNEQLRSTQTLGTGKQEKTFDESNVITYSYDQSLEKTLT